MKNIIIVLLFISPMSLKAQDRISEDTVTVKTIDGILIKMLDLTTRQKGESRNWDTFRDLFLPTATFTVLYNNNSFPQPAETVTLDEFIDLMQDEYYDEGYIEYELGKVVNEYNGIANVFQSVYQKDSDNMEGRAMNSYQLIYFNDRWWIANLVWTAESNGVEIPKEYLKN